MPQCEKYLLHELDLIEQLMVILIQLFQLKIVHINQESWQPNLVLDLLSWVQRRLEESAVFLISWGFLKQLRIYSLLALYR